MSDSDSPAFSDDPERDFATEGPFETSESRLDQLVGETFDSYRIVKPIGEGGMGCVYLADQLEPIRRQVALKILRPGMSTHDMIARFASERHTLARLEHPNIASVYDAGVFQQRPYFAMEFVPGAQIVEYCKTKGLSLNDRLQLFLTVCRGVQHAHQKGIIHRDIKPSNILVTEVDGSPTAKVIDFGIAKAIDDNDAPDITEFGQLIGTLEFMSPEQADLSGVRDIDTRTDVYSLGAVLYQLVCGESPVKQLGFTEAGIYEKLSLIRERTPARPSLATKNNRLPIDQDVDWIVMKALERDRERRYDSPADFARDIERYLEGSAIEARPPSTFYRLSKFSQRHRVPLLAACLVLLAILGGGVASAWWAWQATVAKHDAITQGEEADRQRDRAIESEGEAQKQRSEAERQRDRAQEAERLAKENSNEATEQRDRAKEAEALAKSRLEAVSKERDRAELAESAALESKQETAAALEKSETLLYVNRIALAQREWESGHFSRAKAILNACPEESRQWEWQYINRLCHSEVEKIPSNGYCVSFSKDGKRMAYSGGRGVIILNLETGKQEAELFAAGGVWEIAFSEDGSYLAATHLASFTVWSTETWRPKLSPGRQDFLINHVAFVGPETIVAGGISGTAGVWSLADKAPARLLKGHRNGVGKIFKFGDSQVVMSSGFGISIWDYETGEKVREIDTEPNRMLGRSPLAVFPNGTLAAANAETVRLWNGKTGEKIRDFERRVGAVSAMAISADGKTLAVVGDDQIIMLYKTTGEKIGEIRGSLKGVCNSLAFHPDGIRLAVAERGQAVKIWNYRVDQRFVRLDKGARYYGDIAFISEEEVAVASSGYNYFKLNPSRNPAPMMRNFHARRCAVSTEHQLLAVVYEKPELHIIKPNGVKVQTFETLPSKAKCVAIHPDGVRVATGDRDGRVLLWNIKTGKLERELAQLEFEISGLAFHPDGKSLGVSSHYPSAGQASNQPLLLLDLETGEPAIKLPSFRCEIAGVAISPDGNWIAGAGENGSVYLAKIADEVKRKDILEMKGHSRSVNAVAFHPTQPRLASVSSDHSLKLWDITNGNETLTLNLEETPIVAVDFHPPAID